jgi:hypothetical protein
VNELLNKKSLSRATAVGVGLALGGIMLFLVLWVVLGRAGLDMFARLLASVCIPPAIMAGLMGGYILLKRPAGVLPPNAAAASENDTQ